MTEFSENRIFKIVYLFIKIVILINLCYHFYGLGDMIRLRQVKQMDNLGIHGCGISIIDQAWYIDRMIKVNKLYYVYSGYAFCDGLKMTEGHVYIINDKIEHFWQTGSRFQHMHFDFTFFPTLTIDSIIEIDVAKHPQLSALIQAAEINMQKNYNDETNAALLYALLCVCNKIVPLFTMPSTAVNEIISFIKSAGSMPSVSTLAQLNHMNKCYFIKWFKKETGMTPLAYMNQLRLEKAFVQLKNGGKVEDIAYESEFQSVSAFSTSFKKRYGIPPSKVNMIVQVENRIPNFAKHE